MAKKNGSKDAGMGFGKRGMQDVKEGRGRDAAPLFKKAESPSSVKEMLGDGTKYKHDSN
jgi:hypothetical protein